MPIEQQFDYFLDSAEFHALLEQYAAQPLDKPCWLVVVGIDRAARIEKRYGKNNAAKLNKWVALSIDFRIKRRDVIGFATPGHLAILFHESNLEKSDDVLKITDRLCAALSKDQVKTKSLSWPIKQTTFDIFYKDWEGFLVNIGDSNERIWWARDRKLPNSETTIGYRQQSSFLDLKRELGLRDMRMTVSIGIARLHEGESAENWMDRAMQASMLASEQKRGNTAAVAEEDR